MGDPEGTEFVDAEGLFGEDYLHFYESVLTPELSDAQTALIVRLLDLRPGLRVLDAPCGHGRIAQRLAALGCDVVGIDRDRVFLEHARRSAAAAGVAVDYREADLRRLDFDGEFDAVVNWFTSFGYFDDDTDRALLRSWHRALKPGGRLLIEHQARDRLLGMQQPGSARVEQVGDDLQIDQSSYESLTGRNRTERIIVRGGTVRRTWFSIRMFTPPELRDWLLQAGFESAEAFGQDGQPFGPESRRLVMVARR